MTSDYVRDPNFRRFRLPRVWSNLELQKFSGYFRGDVVNVSGWKDEDKQGGYYRDYFSNATTYTITNFKSDARGFQGQPNEIFLDLTSDLPVELYGKFDVVFNHTTLEHIFETNKAFANLCRMTRDLVIVVVPFLQEMHGDYGDYWRFTPLTIQKLFEQNGLSCIYLNFNSDRLSSVYIFGIGSKQPVKWKELIPSQLKLGLGNNRRLEIIGYNAFSVAANDANVLGRIYFKIKRVFLNLLRADR